MECATSCVTDANKFTLVGRIGIHKLTKMAKPILRLLSRRHRTNAVTPSTCNYECEQNDVNESTVFQVAFRFHNEIEENLENQENDANEALEKRLFQSVATADTVDKQLKGVCAVVDNRHVVLPVSGTFFAVPACFVETVPGQFTWLPLPTPDSDVVRHGDNTPLSQRQLPQQQVPCC